ncbi:MAG: di-trans,poly-cis-decaprenylcistransferase [Candidatus Aquicultor primus]|uniref:Isoprenyl transferase n=1 Tax=Candidatus Aquicultor primus TaxID=1797195 RepID=A0A1F2UM98_9ACTN|nr:MAG: di-trans,poly-cis-decaprenylcistransferase [Candidatus Aquicultor primus]HCG98838.1 isoprenyl transferase [Actinomycetota bacterium]
MKRHKTGLRKGSTGPGGDLSAEEVKKDFVPRHVAVIMDGNGRWASKRKLPRLAGHKAGSNAIRRTIEIATEIGVEYLTLYTFSTENWKRPKDEVSGLMSLFEEQLAKETDELHGQGVRIRVLGRMAELPDSTRKAFTEAIEKTKGNSRLNLNLALNYSGRAEIVDAANALCEAIRSGKETPDITEEMFARYVYTSGIPDPELLIRTSGELRVSNFLLWQIAYSELWITEKLWPDFAKDDFLQAVAEYKQRKRRFGGLVEV